MTARPWSWSISKPRTGTVIGVALLEPMLISVFELFWTEAGFRWFAELSSCRTVEPPTQRARPSGGKKSPVNESRGRRPGLPGTPAAFRFLLLFGRPRQQRRRPPRLPHFLPRRQLRPCGQSRPNRHQPPRPPSGADEFSTEAEAGRHRRVGEYQIQDLSLQRPLGLWQRKLEPMCEKDTAAAGIRAAKNEKHP